MASRARFVLALLTCVVLLGLSASAQGGYKLYAVFSDSDQLKTIDLAAMAPSSSVTITLPGRTVQSAIGLARHPSTGQLYVLLVLSGQTPRELAIVDPATGGATDIGPADNGSGQLGFADITFASDGTLYGVTDAVGSNGLFSLNTSTGQATFLTNLNGSVYNDGEGLAFSAATGLLYHGSWKWVDQSTLFERVNPAAPGDPSVKISLFLRLWEPTALVHWRGDYFLWAIAENLYLVAEDGQVQYQGWFGYIDYNDWDYDREDYPRYSYGQISGLAFAGSPPPCPQALYGAAGNILFAIDPATAAAQMIGPTGFHHMSAIDFSPDATLYGVAGSWGASQVLYTIDPCTGQPTQVGPIGLTGEQAFVTDISIRPSDGWIFATSVGTGELLRIDPASGTATTLANVGGAWGGALAFDLSGTNLYYATFPTGGDNTSQTDLFSLDPENGTATPLGAVSSSVFTYAFSAMDAQPGTGTLFAVTNGVSPTLLMALDPATRQATSIGITAPDMYALAFYSGTPPAEYSLTVFNVPDEGGTVTSDPPGITCPPTCTATFPKGSSVTLGASQNPGYMLGWWGYGSWSGACAGNDGSSSCTVTMNANRTAWAQYDSGWKANIVFAGTGSGQIYDRADWGYFCSSNCVLTIDPGYGGVTLYATAAAGSVFAGWGGDCNVWNGQCGVSGYSDGTYVVTFNLLPLPDTTPPVVSMVNPVLGSTVSGSAVQVAATAIDDFGVVGVQFKLDGIDLGAEDTTASYTVMWDTTQTTNGTHTLTANARDAAGNHGSATVTVTVNNGTPADTTAPTVAFTGPANGSTVSGSALISATAADDVSVVGVQFKLDGINLGAEDATAPYGVVWDTTQVSDGTHTLTADARDAAGNHGTSTVTVTVSNILPLGYQYFIVPFQFRTITGNSLDLDDDESSAVTSPFPVRFAGTTYSTVYVSSNGTIAFEPFADWQNTTIPTGYDPDAGVDKIVAPFWDDLMLYPGSSANVFWEVQGAHPNRQLIVEWRGVNHFDIDSIGEGADITFQVVFFENRDLILFNYDDVYFGSGWDRVNNGNSATVGLQIDWNAGTQFQQSLSSGTSIVWSHLPVLAVTLDGAGSGSVVGTPPGIDCGASCLAPFDVGAVVTLTATPTPGSTFTGWSGACTGNSDCTVTIGTSTTLTAAFALLPDATPPTVSITAPLHGATVSGSALTVSATASDNLAVAGVQFKLDGANLGAEDTTAPYSLLWDSTQVQDGQHTLTADARDAAGNVTTAGISVTVNNPINPPPDTTAPTVAITVPGNGVTVSGPSVTLSATATDNVGVVGVQFKLDGANLGVEDTTAPYSLVWDTTQVADGTRTLTADARDAAGNHATSTVNVTVNNTPPPPDTTAPTVSISSHAPGSVVSGTSVTVAANAADNVGVAGLQFKVDGVNLGGEDTTAPYAIAWDTTRTPNGSHTLTVSARDAAGNIGVSVAITLTVNNSTEFALGPASGSPTSLAIVAGGTATFKLNVAPTAGFTGPVSFTCTGAPQFSTCTISPNPANVSGTTATPITVTLTTTAKSSRNPSQLASGGAPRSRKAAFVWAVLLLPGVVFLRGAKLRGRGVPLLLAAMLVLMMLFGCGGGGSRVIQEDFSFTRPSTYPITVTGTSGSVTQSFNLSLTVS